MSKIHLKQIINNLSTKEKKLGLRLEKFKYIHRLFTNNWQCLQKFRRLRKVEKY